jgi:hypothetical protein
LVFLVLFKNKIDSECLAIAYGWLEPDGTK